ncbi:MAG: sugar phosphate isomerase/epimerase [Planctomycetaceae bacterium]|nr:sugar phosphate isomerase/epimerase [Planctomycetaceae bacterium]
MFVAGSTICFPELDFAEACQALTDLEYDRVEVWLSPNSRQLHPADVARDPDAFVALYRETTRLTAIAFSLETDVSPREFEGLSKASKLLQVTQITVPASVLGTPFNAEIDRLRLLTQIASQDGVRVSIRTERGHLTEDPETAVELCGSVPGLGLTLDPSPYLLGPRPVTSFERFAPHVFHVHLRDSTREQLQVSVGLGEIDYSRLISQLARERYDRALCVALIPELTDVGTRALEMRKLRMLLDSLL